MKNKGKNQAEKSKLSVTCFSVAEECYKNDPVKLEKYRKQREEQGFDDTETWHLDKTLALFLIPRLKRFIQVNNGFPNGETIESYIEKLRFVIKSFEEYYLEENVDTSLEIEKERLKNAQQAVELLSKLWFCLWW
jgi:uncharacterized protein YqcC (DUF446 family)